MNQKITRIEKKLKKQLDQNRYDHTLGVMYTAASLAMCHGEDVQKALLAGMLHDCAKCIPGEKKVKLCQKHHLNVSEVEKKNPSLLHAKLGAYLAEKEYGIDDEDILNAIRSHTTGRPGMSKLEKIIFIADYIEPGRQELPNMKDVRKLAFCSLDECLCRILKDTLAYLRRKKAAIDTTTEMTFEYYVEAEL